MKMQTRVVDDLPAGRAVRAVGVVVGTFTIPWPVVRNTRPDCPGIGPEVEKFPPGVLGEHQAGTKFQKRITCSTLRC